MEDIYQFSQLFFQLVLEGELRKVELVWEEFHSVGYPCILGAREVASIVPIVLQSWTNVVSSTGMFSPCAPFPCSVMDSYLTARWCHWCLIIIKVAMDECVS